MRKFQIVSSEGVNLGIYEAKTFEEALDAMARDAGYRDAAHAAEVAGPFTGYVEEVEDHSAVAGEDRRRALHERLHGIEVEDHEQGTVFRREVSRAEVAAIFRGLPLLAWLGEKLVVEHAVYIEHGATSDGGALVAQTTSLFAITGSERDRVAPRAGLDRKDRKKVEEQLYKLLARGQEETLDAAVFEAEAELERWLASSEED